MTATVFNLTYTAIDDQDREISLLDGILPYNTFYLLEDYIVDGGDFDIAEGYGLDTDAGNLDDGTITVSSYSYEAGNFDTGDEVFYPSLPIVDENGSIDGGLNYKAEDRYYLMNLDFEPLYETEIPRNTYLITSVLEASVDIELNQGFSFEINKYDKFFPGFDYGGRQRRSGEPLDFGSIADPLTEDYNFSSIANYQEPYPGSYIL